MTAIGDLSGRVLAFVGECPAGTRAAEVAATIGADVAVVRSALSRLAASGLIERTSRGVYAAPASECGVPRETQQAQRSIVTSANDERSTLPAEPAAMPVELRRCHLCYWQQQQPGADRCEQCGAALDREAEPVQVSREQPGEVRAL